DRVDARPARAGEERRSERHDERARRDLVEPHRGGAERYAEAVERGEEREREEQRTSPPDGERRNDGRGDEDECDGRSGRHGGRAKIAGAVVAGTAAADTADAITADALAVALGRDV